MICIQSPGGSTWHINISHSVDTLLYCWLGLIAWPPDLAGWEDRSSACQMIIWTSQHLVPGRLDCKFRLIWIASTAQLLHHKFRSLTSQLLLLLLIYSSSCSCVCWTDLVAGVIWCYCCRHARSLTDCFIHCYVCQRMRFGLHWTLGRDGTLFIVCYACHVRTLRSL